MTGAPNDSGTTSGDVSQFDVVEFVGDAFTRRPQTREALIELAWSRGARPAVLDQLRRLAAGRYGSVADLTAGLRGLPATLDPWEPIDR